VHLTRVFLLSRYTGKGRDSEDSPFRGLCPYDRLCGSMVIQITIAIRAFA
jgi:hypothetical protein